jgi:hypothetical protein
MLPYGMDGTKDAAGTPCWPDFAGGGGSINEDFVKVLKDPDSPLARQFATAVLNRYYFKPPFTIRHGKTFSSPRCSRRKSLLTTIPERGCPRRTGPHCQKRRCRLHRRSRHRSRRVRCCARHTTVSTRGGGRGGAYAGPGRRGHSRRAWSRGGADAGRPRGPDGHTLLRGHGIVGSPAG